MRLVLTLSDDGKTFTVEHADAVSTVDATHLIRALPDDFKAPLRASILDRVELTRNARDHAEADRANALERRRARDEELNALEALAAELPEPDPEPQPAAA